MSPTVLRKNGFRFYFYSNEHIPIHIHVEKWDRYMKYDLENNHIIENNFKKIEENEVLSIMFKNKEKLIISWKNYFNKKYNYEK